MTPEGLKREVDIDRMQSVTPDTGKKINTLIVVLLVLAIGGLVADRLIPESSVDADDAALLLSMHRRPSTLYQMTDQSPFCRLLI